MIDIKSLLGKSAEQVNQLFMSAGITRVVFETVEDVSYLSARDAGISCVIPNGGVASAVHLYSAGRDGFSEYGGDLPETLKFSMTRDQVIHILGKPAARGGGGVIPILGKRAEWDKFEVGGGLETV